VSRWVWLGIRRGVTTTAYPAAPETAAGVSPGLPRGGPHPAHHVAAVAARCPTGALTARDGEVVVDARRCVHNYRCRRGVATPLAWSAGYEWATAIHGDGGGRPLERAFRRSIHVLVVDAGDCGACLHEVKQLDNPYYNMHRLGFFLTPSPRHADVLLVVGPVTDHVRLALVKAYDAMPTPKRVLAVGTCALSGGVFGPSFVSEGGVRSVLPVDVEVPGQPPPPLAILHALLVAVGRSAPAAGTPGSPAPRSPAARGVAG
jgi:Ni,Fe-hydrogenase III small subunit